MHDVCGHRLLLDNSNVFCDLRINRMFKRWELHVRIMKTVNIHVCSTAFCFLVIRNCWTISRSASRLVIWLTLRSLLLLSSSGSLFVRARIGICTVSDCTYTKSWNYKNTKFMTCGCLQNITKLEITPTVYRFLPANLYLNRYKQNWFNIHNFRCTFLR